MLTLILDCDMIFMLGRSGKECPFFVPVSRMVGGVVLRAANPESNDCRGQSYLDSYDPALQGVPVCRAQKKKLHRNSAPTYHIPITNAVRPVCPRRLAARNDPWRFRQQSSRVISIQFWYLTSLFTSLSIGSDMDIQDGKCQNLYV